MDDEEVDVFNTSGDSRDLNTSQNTVRSSPPNSGVATPTGANDDIHTPLTPQSPLNDSPDGVIFNQLNFVPLDSMQGPPDMSPLQSNATSPKDMSFEDLQVEVAKLNVLLNQSRSENRKAAQAGLDLLEEKANIQREYSIVLEECSRLRDDLKTTQAALDQKIAAERMAREISRDDEDELEREKFTRESVLSESVNQLQHDLKRLRETANTLQLENEQLATREKELSDLCRTTEKEKIDLKNHLKQAREREKRVNEDVFGLEEENVHLLQQVSHLKSRQIENDKLRGERDRLEEKCVELTKECDELLQMKETFKSYYEKTIEALNCEKELKKSYQQEVETLKHSQVTHYVPFTQERSINGHFNCEEDSLHPDFPSNPTAVTNSEDPFYDAEEGGGGYLCLKDELSELQSNLTPVSTSEVFGIEYEDSEGSLQSMTPRDDTHAHSRSGTVSSQFESAADEIEFLKKRNVLLQQEVNQLKMSGGSTDSNHQQRMPSASMESNSNTLETEAPSDATTQNAELALKQECDGLKTQLAHSKEKLKEKEKRVNKLEDENRSLVSCAFTTLDEVVALSNEIKAVQHTVAQYTPNHNPTHSYTQQVDEETAKEGGDSVQTKVHPGHSKTLSERLLELCNTLESAKLLESEKFDSEFPIKLITSVQEQLRVLKRACENSLSILTKELAATKTSSLSHNAEGSSENGNVASEISAESHQSLIEQNDKLKAEIIKKREQVTSLRAVLKANKQTAEMGLSQMRSRFDQEKRLLVENGDRLRNELTNMKEDAATFAYIRSIFVSRCDALTNQCQSKQKECKRLQDEKNTLEKLLRMAINQKLALTERLESLENERETITMASKQQQQQLQPSTSANSQRSPQKNKPRVPPNPQNMRSRRNVVPPQYAKNPRASDPEYLKRMFVQNNT